MKEIIINKFVYFDNLLQKQIHQKIFNKSCRDYHMKSVCEAFEVAQCTHHTCMFGVFKFGNLKKKCLLVNIKMLSMFTKLLPADMW